MEDNFGWKLEMATNKRAAGLCRSILAVGLCHPVCLLVVAFELQRPQSASISQMSHERNLRAISPWSSNCHRRIWLRFFNSIWIFHSQSEFRREIASSRKNYNGGSDLSFKLAIIAVYNKLKYGKEWHE